MIFDTTDAIISLGFGIFVWYLLLDNLPVFGIPLGLVVCILSSLFLYDWLQT